MLTKVVPGFVLPAFYRVFTEFLRFDATTIDVGDNEMPPGKKNKREGGGQGEGMNQKPKMPRPHQ